MILKFYNITEKLPNMLDFLISEIVNSLIIKKFRV